MYSYIYVLVCMYGVMLLYIAQTVTVILHSPNIVNISENSEFESTVHVL